jgi:hypothetical protein
MKSRFPLGLYITVGIAITITQLINVSRFADLIKSELRDALGTFEIKPAFQGQT